jgi:hypothetical protein
MPDLCPWDVDPTDLGVCSTWADYPETTQEAALSMATLYLWGVTGRRFGLCPLTVRPSQTRWDPVAYQAFPVWPGQESNGPSGPFLFGGRWFNAGCGTACCGARACAVVLRGPVASIDEVLVDGDEVPSSAYRVDVTDGTYLLVRVDGECWPVCQNFSRETEQDGTFEVAYRIGSEPPAALLIAAALLACEYAKGLTGGACRLPARMTRLTRQGVEVEVEPASPDEGRTGIREVDDVIASLNPSRRQRPPLLLSPDLPERCDRVTVVPVGGS